MTAVIRSARPDDLLPLARVIVDTFLVANQDLLPPEVLARRAQTWTYDVSAAAWGEVLADLESGNSPAACLLVAEVAADRLPVPEVIGMAYGFSVAETPGLGEVDMLYVRGDWQGCGVGKQLLAAVIRHFLAHGLTAARLFTPEAAAQARRVYAGLGGQITGTRTDMEDGVPIPLVMYTWDDLPALLTRCQRPSGTTP